MKTPAQVRITKPEGYDVWHWICWRCGRNRHHYTHAETVKVAEAHVLFDDCRPRLRVVR